MKIKETHQGKAITKVLKKIRHLYMGKPPQDRKLDRAVLQAFHDYDAKGHGHGVGRIGPILVFVNSTIDGFEVELFYKSM